MGATLKAETPTQPGEGDTSLPDPSPETRKWLLGGLVVAAAIALLMNKFGATGDGFEPPKGAFSFSLFAGFYAVTQIIERLMELAVPLLPVKSPETDSDADNVAQVKADRAKLGLALATVLGVIASNAFGLFFLQTIGITASNTVDSIATGLVIGAGTKPLHDFITLLQAQTAPKTKTTVAAAREEPPT